MNQIKNLPAKQGIILIICLILLVVLAGISLTLISTSTVNNKAAKYNSAKIEAQQKANAIVNFAVASLNSMDKATTNVTPCAMAKDSLIWSSVPDDIMASTSTPTKKQWWRTYGWDYPQANALHAITDYFSRTGAEATDPVATYAITQAAIDNSDPQKVVRTFKIIAYATNALGSAAAIKETYYTWSFGASDCVGTAKPVWNPIAKVCTTMTYNRWYGYTTFAPQGYYACYEQNPPVGASNDPRITWWYADGQCWCTSICYYTNR